MPGVSRKTREEIPENYRGPRRSLPRRRHRGIRNLRVRYHGPGEHCWHCPCHSCHMFYVVDPPSRGVEVATLEDSRPKYSDLCFVNSWRDAAAKREEERQEKLRAEREAAAAAVEASKKDKASKDEPKND